MYKYDYLVVGSGLFGSTFAEIAKRHNKKILVIDQRSHIGGNCYTKEQSGIQMHMYGPHVFHTNSRKIWDYINRFCEFNHFTNRIKVNFQNQIYSFPINLFTLHQLWGVNTPEEAWSKLQSTTHHIENPQNMEEWCLANIGSELYEKFIEGYTTKQWRTSPKNLPPSIIRRIPIRFTYDDNYYNDAYQGIPKGGYTKIFEQMLDGVEVKLNCTLEKGWRRYAKKLVYSGRPEILLDFKYGELPYLTLAFDHIEKEGDHQGNAIINYTDKDVPYTRCVEHKHFEFGQQKNTIITYEKPIDWHKDATPYYPVPTAENKALYQQYFHEIAKQDDILLGGRLGKYSYFNMDQTIANAMLMAETEMKH